MPVSRHSATHRTISYPTPSMYIPPHFAESRPEQLHRIIREHPLGALVTQGAAGLDADHMPFEFDPGVGPHGIALGPCGAREHAVAALPHREAR